MPEPVPASSIRQPESRRREIRSSKRKDIAVVACSPVPKAAPAGITNVPALGGGSIHGALEVPDDQAPAHPDDFWCLCLGKQRGPIKTEFLPAKSGDYSVTCATVFTGCLQE